MRGRVREHSQTAAASTKMSCLPDSRDWGKMIRTLWPVDFSGVDETGQRGRAQPRERPAPKWSRSTWLLCGSRSTNLIHSIVVDDRLLFLCT